MKAPVSSPSFRSTVSLLGPLLHYDAVLTTIEQGSTAHSGLALAALIAFVFAYVLVVLEDVLHLRKSKPVVLAAGLMWLLTALALPAGTDIHSRVEHYIGEFGALVLLLLLLLVAMTYISAISERNVFLWINAWLVSRGFGLRVVFWITGVLSFVISLSTAGSLRLIPAV